MPNHFHFLIRVKDEGEISNPVRVLNPDGVRKIKSPSQQFSNLNNSYAQAFNKRFNRHGGLFERPFKRKLVTEDNYLRQLVLYIHNNPVHHGFTEAVSSYPWSSYLSFLSTKPTRIKRKMIIDLFDDMDNFIVMHDEKVEVTTIEKWLDLV